MWNEIVGWSDGFEPLYRELVPTLRKNAHIVEIGVAFGRSIALLDHLVQATGKAMSITAVDKFSEHMGGEQSDKREWYAWARAQGTPLAAFRAALEKHSPGTLERVEILSEPSTQAAERFAENSVDLVCIDATHEYQSVLEDIAAWRPKVRRGGWLIGDDYSFTFPGVMQAVQESFDRFEVCKYAWRVRMA